MINKIEESLETVGLVVPGLLTRAQVSHAAHPTVVNVIHINNTPSE